VLLVDSSIWIEVFRRRDPLDLEAITPLVEIATCLPVIQEVLQGMRDEKQHDVARAAMLAFPIVESPLTTGVFLEAAALYRKGRKAGITIRSGVDCLVAVCALRNGLTVLHRDRDFDRIAEISRLKTLSP